MTPSKGIPGLVGEALAQAADLVGNEVALFRLEAKQGLDGILGGVVLFATAAVIAVIALFMPILALVKGLTVLLGSESLAALVVGGGFGLVSLVLLALGLSRMSIAALEPERTRRQLARDATLTKEHIGR